VERALDELGRAAVGEVEGVHQAEAADLRHAGELREPRP